MSCTCAGKGREYRSDLLAHRHLVSKQKGRQPPYLLAILVPFISLTLLRQPYLYYSQVSFICSSFSVVLANGFVNSLYSIRTLVTPTERFVI